MLNRISAFLLLALVSCAFGLDAPKVDAAKYPQDTPDKALDTMQKVLDTQDYAYWITWVVTPDSTQRTLEKYKTLDAAVEASKTEEAKVKGRVMTLDIIKNVMAAKKTEEGTENGTPFFRFKVDDASFLQFDKQADGRWCFNPRARTGKATVAPATK
jgi:hypothetical protein